MKTVFNIFVGVLTIFLVTTPTLFSAVTIPIDHSQGLVIVEVTLNGTIEGKFGIDTGADFLYIDKEFAKKNNLKFVNSANRRTVKGHQGSDDPLGIFLKTLEIGNEKIQDLNASAVDFGSLISTYETLKLDGLIGYEILKKYYVTVDYKQRQLTLQKDKPEFINGKQYKPVEFKMYKHFMLVETELEQSKSIPMILDYCSSHTLIDPGLAEELGLPILSKRPVRLSEVRISKHIVSTDVVTYVSDQSRIKNTIPRANFGGTLGGSFLKDHVVTVDYRSKLLYFHQSK